MKIVTKFIILSVLLLSVTLGTGFLIYKNSQISAQQKVAVDVVQRHMDADMMHDGIRGNVYSALVASTLNDAKLLVESREEVAAMSADFTKNVDENLNADIPADIHQQFLKVKESVAEYASYSQKLSSQANDFAAAAGMLPGFNRVFGVLETDQEDATNLILSWSEGLLKSGNLYTALLQVAVVILVFLSLSVPFFAMRIIFKPISVMQSAMTELTSGNTEVVVPYADHKDELGEMAGCVQVFKDNLVKIAHETEAKAKILEQEQEKRAAMEGMAIRFEKEVKSVIGSFAHSVEDLRSTANRMRDASENTTHISAIVAAAALEADTNVQTVAAAAEELTASSDEISRQVDSVAKKASQAAADAENTSASVGKLNELANSIGEVVGAIRDIAEQTNLLALNATIEAARAGEAGKGFAVVADEVKKLASETATKTEQIGERVDAIQTAIRESVQAMEAIISNVKLIDEATTSVASAVEEQNAATGEIGRSVAEASTGTQQVSSGITDVEKNAADTMSAADAVMTSTKEMATLSEGLSQEINSFLNKVRGV